MKILKGLLIVGIPLLLIASVGLNYVLIKRSVREFKETQNLRLDPISQNRFAKKNADLGAPLAQGSRVVFLGDSRIAQWQNLPEIGNAERVNRGVGGETTAQVLLRADRDVTGIGASLVVIQAGINDLKTLGVVPKRKEEIKKSCLKNLTDLCRRFSQAKVKVALMTIFPVGEVDLGRKLIWDDTILQALEEVNAELRKISLPNVTILDCDPILKEGDRIKSSFSKDTLHLNPAGYKALNLALEEKLKEALGGGN